MPQYTECAGIAAAGMARSGRAEIAAGKPQKSVLRLGFKEDGQTLNEPCTSRSTARTRYGHRPDRHL
jgi:hypothetical protein